MRVFLLGQGRNLDDFAQALPHDEMHDTTEYCPKCGVAGMTRKFPMVIEWEVEEYGVGSDVIADFTRIGGSELMVSSRVRSHLEGRTKDVEFGPVEMRQDPKLKRPKRITSRTKRRIWLPYEGPPLWDFIVKGRGDADFEASGWIIKFQCPGCGLAQHNSVRDNQPLIFPRDRWDGSDFFLSTTNVRWAVFVTERGKELLESGDFSNLTFRERGRIE